MPGTDRREIWLFKLTCCVDHCYISQDDQQTNIKIERRTPGVIQGSLWWMFTFMTPSQWHTCFSQNQQVVLFPLVVTWWTDLVSFPFGLKPKYLEKNYNHPLLFDQKLYVWQKRIQELHHLHFETWWWKCHNLGFLVASSHKL